MAGLVYKWRIGNCKNAYLTDRNGGDPFITVDIVDEEKISLVVKDFTEEEYKSKYELMCNIIAEDPDGKNMVMLDYKYYYNIDETSCGLSQYGGDMYIGDQGPMGVGIKDIKTISGTVYTILRIYLTDGKFYDVKIPNGKNGINGSDGSDGSDGEDRNVIFELETQKEEINNIREEILAAARNELEEKLKLSQEAIESFAMQLSGLTHSMGSATTHVDNVIGLEEKVNLYIKYSAMTKTQFNNIINPYSGFMETVGSRVDLLSSSVTYYGNKIDIANSELKEAMSYYDQTANQLNEYWRKYDAVNNRLETVVAELTGNSTLSLSEIYQTAKEVGLMVTGDNTDVNGDPITAAIIAKINDTASTISIKATKIDLLGETVAEKLGSFDLNINGGYSYFSADGSGWIANHGIEWTKNGDMTIKGQLSIGTIVDGLGKQDVALGQGTDARTIFSKDGSGSLAGGNIYWDKYGMLTIKKDVNIEGTLSVDEIADGLGNKIVSFGKENDNATTYFYPDGSGSLAGGAISWDTDGSIKIAGDLIVGGSIMQEVVEQLDGENVSLGGGSANFNGHEGSGSLAGGLITWIRNNDGTASMKISGSVTIGDTTSGDTVNSVIAALNVSDVSIGNGSTFFDKDGSGYLANKAIEWDSGGTMTITNKCKIAKFNIDDEGIYNGNINEWANEGVGQRMAYLTPSILRLQYQKNILGTASKFEKLKVGFGTNADPTHSGGPCDSAAYFYRRMMNTRDTNSFFYPAVKIISENLLNGNVALYVKGSVINRNGSLNNCYFMNADEDSTIHFDRSDTQIVINTKNGSTVQLPTKADMQEMMGVNTFAVRLTVIAHLMNKVNFKLAFNSNDANKTHPPVWEYNDGSMFTEIEMKAGKVLHFVLISYGDENSANGGFWAQVL